MIQNFPFKQNQTLIDLQKIKSQINLILSEFERQIDLSDDVKTLLTSGYSLTVYNDMTNLKSFIQSLIPSQPDLESEVKTLFTTTYDTNDYDAMTNFKSYIQSLLTAYELSTSLKNDVKTLLTSTFSSTDYSTMTNLTTYINSLMSAYELGTNLANDVKNLLSTSYSVDDYFNMYNLNQFLNERKGPYVFIGYRGQNNPENQYYFLKNNDINVNFKSNCYRIVYIFFCRTANQPYYDNIYVFRVKDQSTSSGSIVSAVNIFPSTYTPWIQTIGYTNTSMSGDCYIEILIGYKRILINMGSQTSNVSNTVAIKRVRIMDPEIVNFDEALFNGVPQSQMINTDFNNITTSMAGLGSGTMALNPSFYFEYTYHTANSSTTLSGSNKQFGTFTS